MPSTLVWTGITKAKLVAFGEISRADVFRTPHTQIAWVRSGGRTGTTQAIAVGSRAGSVPFITLVERPLQPQIDEVMRLWETRRAGERPVAGGDEA